jgi:hypothetical protein
MYRFKEERKILSTTKRKANWIDHILPYEYVIERKRGQEEERKKM